MYSPVSVLDLAGLQTVRVGLTVGLMVSWLVLAGLQTERGI